MMYGIWNPLGLVVSWGTIERVSLVRVSVSGGDIPMLYVRISELDYLRYMSMKVCFRDMVLGLRGCSGRLYRRNIRRLANHYRSVGGVERRYKTEKYWLSVSVSDLAVVFLSEGLSLV